MFSISFLCSSHVTNALLTKYVNMAILSFRIFNLVNLMDLALSLDFEHSSGNFD